MPAEQFDGKILGQLRPSNTSAASIYSPATEVKIARLFGIFVTNTTSTATTFSLYVDNDGAVFDEDSALFFDTILGVNSSIHIEFTDKPLTLNNESANFGVKSGTNNAVNFTLYGEEKVRY